VKDSGFMMEGLVTSFDETLFTITTKKERALVAVFMRWLTKEARLRPVPDLQKRITDLEPKLRKMAKNLQVSIKDGKLVIRSDADSESLLALLRRGSAWFEPIPSLETAILLGLSNGS
jgi:hypothetical protein